jgi:hypothetical protein
MASGGCIQNEAGAYGFASIKVAGWASLLPFFVRIRSWITSPKY